LLLAAVFLESVFLVAVLLERIVREARPKGDESSWFDGGRMLVVETCFTHACLDLKRYALATNATNICRNAICGRAHAARLFVGRTRSGAGDRSVSGRSRSRSRSNILKGISGNSSINCLGVFNAGTLHAHLDLVCYALATNFIQPGGCNTRPDDTL
jgi:hypothetical protein